MFREELLELLNKHAIQNLKVVVSDGFLVEYEEDINDKKEN